MTFDFHSYVSIVDSLYLPIPSKRRIISDTIFISKIVKGDCRLSGYHAAAIPQCTTKKLQKSPVVSYATTSHVLRLLQCNCINRVWSIAGILLPHRIFSVNVQYPSRHSPERFLCQCHNITFLIAPSYLFLVFLFVSAFSISFRLFFIFGFSAPYVDLLYQT